MKNIQEIFYNLKKYRCYSKGILFLLFYQAWLKINDICECLPLIRTEYLLR